MSEREAALARVAALWPEARRIAERRCAHNLHRLARGEGGFYDADDLIQDLFVEFWALMQRPELAEAVAAGATLADEPLRSAWSRALWGGGMRILRRAPQRLWSRLEKPMAPELLDGAVLDADDPAADGLAARLTQVLAELGRQDEAQLHSALESIAALSGALARLKPVPRQVLYLAMLQGLPAEAIAAQLGLGSANAVGQRVQAARAERKRQGGMDD
ncbi:MAG: sigma factor-like helix-turn-helix DNA-binding protein [Anaerolineales bacterium]